MSGYDMTPPRPCKSRQGQHSYVNVGPKGAQWEDPAPPLPPKGLRVHHEEDEDDDNNDYFEMNELAMDPTLPTHIGFGSEQNVPRARRHSEPTISPGFPVGYNTKEHRKSLASALVKEVKEAVSRTPQKASSPATSPTAQGPVSRGVVGRSHSSSGPADFGDKLEFFKKQDRISAPVGNEMDKPPKVSPQGMPNAQYETDLNVYPWFYGGAKRPEAEMAVCRRRMDGTFVVRPSSQNTEGYPFTLTVYCEGQVFHLYIRRHNYYYAVGFAKESERVRAAEKWFPTLSALIEHHNRTPLMLAGPNGQVKTQTLLKQWPT